MDFSRLTIDNTNYVSDTFKESFADIVVKTKMRAGSGDKKPREIDADIYILVEHKCYREAAILIQLLRYMYLMWQLDIDENKPLRVIIPIVFYHGKEKWNIPQSFAGQFNVSREVKEFLLDYRYVLFDTGDWNFKDRKNDGLKDNVFLLTALALMKSAFNEEVDTIREIFKFWHEKGFAGDLDKVLLFMAYIYETKNLSQDKLKKMLEESKINGGDIMQTLAQKLRKEGERIGEERGEKRGEKRGKLETARELVKRGVDMGIIADATGLPRDEIEKLASTVH
jgi:predicted transposase/invertase (TIGR01784 family)